MIKLSDAGRVTYPADVITDRDIYLMKEGSHLRLYEKLGSRAMALGGEDGVFFALLAPGAVSVAVAGEFNNWNTVAHPLRERPGCPGLWEGFMPCAGSGDRYAYAVTTSEGGNIFFMTDPFAPYPGGPVKGGPVETSTVWELGYEWGDREWMEGRPAIDLLASSMALYSIDASTWRCVPEEGRRPLFFRELAPYLEDYVREVGFTHVEFRSRGVKPQDAAGLSWAVTPLTLPGYGKAEEFCYITDRLHRIGVGVAVSWALPGLTGHDGQGPEQGCFTSTVLSAALSWFERYHVDILTLHLPPSLARATAGREEDKDDEAGHRAAELLRRLNIEAYSRYPGIQTIASADEWSPEGEYTAGVTMPAYAGGLGFGLETNGRWSKDTVKYFYIDPIYRKYDHDLITSSLLYAFSENFLLYLEPNHYLGGSGGLIDGLPGDPWQRRANLKVMLGYLYAYPGKKRVVMGDEFGGSRSARWRKSLDWHLLEDPAHKAIKRWVEDLNRLYRTEISMYGKDFDLEGFEWIDFHDRENSVISFVRKGSAGTEPVLMVFNLTPVARRNYRVGVPGPGLWVEILNSNAREYGGTGMGNFGGVEAAPVPAHEREHSVSLTLPPLAVIFFKPVVEDEARGRKRWS